MKKFLNVSLFLMTIGAAFAFKPHAELTKAPYTNQTVWYNSGGTCNVSKSCSNFDNGINCVDGISSYSNQQSPCNGTSAFKFLP